MLVRDVRFPTSLTGAGSDALNLDNLHEHFVEPVDVRGAAYRPASG